MKNFDFLDKQITKDFMRRAKKVKPLKEKLKKPKIKFGRKAYLEAEFIVNNLDYSEMF